VTRSAIGVCKDQNPILVFVLRWHTLEELEEDTVIRGLLAILGGKNCCGQESSSAALPKGLEAAPPIENPKLRELLEGPDITASGGVNLVANGRPMRSGQAEQTR